MMVPQRISTSAERSPTRCGDSSLRAHHDHWSALRALFLGHTPEAIGLYRRAIEVHRRLGDDAAALTASFQLAMAQTYDGSYDAALDTCAHRRRPRRAQSSTNSASAPAPRSARVHAHQP